MSETPLAVPLLPVGVRHAQTSGFAASWEAYDALTQVDGWQEKAFEGSSWKEFRLAEGRVTVFSPTEEKP